MDNRKFEEVVRGIVSAEKDVDKVLAAAKLTRKERERMDTTDIMALMTMGLMILMGLLFLVGLFWLMMR